MADIDNTQDILDIRDIFERIEELEEEKESALEGLDPSKYGNRRCKKWREWEDSPEFEELKNLEDFVSEFCGYGGNERWRGDWYPVTLIRDDYFEDYTEELLKDCGYLPNDLPSWIEIDWGKTADNVKVDYTSGEFDGVTYWGR